MNIPEQNIYTHLLTGRKYHLYCQYVFFIGMQISKILSYLGFKYLDWWIYANLSIVSNVTTRTCVHMTSFIQEALETNHSTSVLCAICCLCVWNINSWLSLRFSLTFYPMSLLMFSCVDVCKKKMYIVLYNSSGETKTGLIDYNKMNTLAVCLRALLLFRTWYEFYSLSLFRISDHDSIYMF